MPPATRRKRGAADASDRESGSAELVDRGDKHLRINGEVCREPFGVLRLAGVVELLPQGRRELLDEIHRVERSHTL